MKRKTFLANLRWILLLLLAAACLVYGCLPAFGREEWELVLAKAVTICFQCIGLG